ncbi:hypothetical protein [Leptolyngbya sp. CCY15150]|uniref:hypothetical protein n=1 Tax=Leptolyngbya sp. CCY15150 TaxID=2767772 RepID=UPI00194F3919|nr:hypothetical protein [Leptolyngbya sp. CCY15150]
MNERSGAIALCSTSLGFLTDFRIVLTSGWSGSAAIALSGYPRHLVSEMTHGQSVSRLYYGNFLPQKGLRRCSQVIQLLVTNG